MGRSGGMGSGGARVEDALGAAIRVEPDGVLNSGFLRRLLARTIFVRAGFVGTLNDGERHFGLNPLSSCQSLFSQKFPQFGTLVWGPRLIVESVVI